MPDPWLAMAIVAGVYLAMFGAGEVARRSLGARADLTRRFGHVGAGVIALALPLMFASPEPVIALAVAFVVFLTVTRRAGWLGSIHAIDRRSGGAFLYPVAVAAAFVLAADDYPRYAIAVLALGIGDAVGGIVGGRWGGHRYAAWGQLKTWEGSLAVFVTLVVVTVAVLMLDGRPIVDVMATALFVGVVVTLIEGALPWGLDNLAIPIATVLALEVADSGGPAGPLVVAACALFAIAVAAPRRASAGKPQPAAEALPADQELAPRGG